MKILQILLVLFVFSLPAYAVEIVHYSNSPITIELSPDIERSIDFGDHVRVGITKGQKMKQLFRVQSAQGVVHLKAKKEFAKQRIQVEKFSDGRVILIDLISTKDKKSNELVKVVLEKDNKPKAQTDAPEEKSHIITPVELTRYASQQLFGPRRLHKNVAGISNIPVPFNDHIKVFKGENKFFTTARPIMAIKGGGYYLTSLLIKNVTKQPISLSYLDINIPFSHATFQHQTIHEVGSVGDSTVLYLLSKRPLKSTLYPWNYYQDLAAEKGSE